MELERYLFQEANLKCNTYFIYIDDKNKLPSHSFLTFEMNNKYCWFEHSWYDYKGIHEYETLEDLLTDVKNKFVDSKKSSIDIQSDTYIYKYNKPNARLNCQEIYKYIKTQKLYKFN